MLTSTFSPQLLLAKQALVSPTTGTSLVYPRRPMLLTVNIPDDIFEDVKDKLTGVITVLYNFMGGTDGSGPFGALIRDAAGNLYGTTSLG